MTSVIFEGHFDDLFTAVSLCAQLTCDLLVIAMFPVNQHDVSKRKMQKATVNAMAEDHIDWS